MKQLPRIFLLTGVTLVVLIALLVTGLRLVLPQLNQWREPLFEQLSSAAGIPLTATELHGEWQNFGPVVEINNLQVILPSQGKINVKRLSLALDVWQSLLHLRWQFRDLTFHQLNATIDTPLTSDKQARIQLTPNVLSDLFLTQIDHFTLRNSQIDFLTLNGERATLAIPELMWLNGENRHRAEGVINLSSFSGQHGALQVRLDLADTNGYLDTGRIWMQANDIDARPWLGKWMKDNTSLESARVSVATWIHIREGKIESGDIAITQGTANWRDANQSHQLTLEKITGHLLNTPQGWQLNFPQINLATDGEPWPTGQLGVLWQAETPETEVIRVRASHFALERLATLVPLFTRLMPEAADNWQMLHPHGQVQLLAADIPLSAPKDGRFLVKVKDVGWQQWKNLPAMSHLSGELSGAFPQGEAQFSIANASIPYEGMFKAPLQVMAASGKLSWTNNDAGFTLAGKQWQLEAHALKAKGDFTYTRYTGQSPRLELLAGLRVSDAGEAWRYFPHAVMEPPLVNYLSNAIKGGQASDASLIFAGNPGDFPFKKNEGMFEVFVPLRHATFQFQPSWPALTDFDIDLDFANNGLSMQAQSLLAGKVPVRNVTATIPDYRQEKLFITGDIRGDGQDISHYFSLTPLKPTLGSALQQVQLQGEVAGKLHLTIPLNGHDVVAEGDVNLDNTALVVKPLDTTLQQLRGRFTYQNGTLQSGPLSGRWFGQPVSLRFSTEELEERFAINIDLQGDWQPGMMHQLPFSSALSGRVNWQSHITVDLPHQGTTQYSVTVNGDLKEVSSHLPKPLSKTTESALAVQLQAKGNLTGFTLQGKLGKAQFFNSRWLLGKQLHLEKLIWQSDAQQLPELPREKVALLSLPALDGDTWLALLARESATSNLDAVELSLPAVFTLRTPALNWGGQQWRDLNITTEQRVSGGRDIQVEGSEIKGTLKINNRMPWELHLGYLYYNPLWSGSDSPLTKKQDEIDFSQWPPLNLRCDTCWLRGQNVGRISAELSHTSDTLRISHGVIDSGVAELTLDGEWVNRPGAQRTAIKGSLKGKNITPAAERFDLTTPLRDSAFNIDYDLHWQSLPWQPVIPGLSGVLSSHLGAGHITDVNTGRAGQLLRLVSVDALLRKLRLDFSDTFSKDFYFDDIKGTAWIEKGVIHTDNLLVDGLEADIAMKGRVNLVTRQLDMQAVVAPEISATVGVATAFVINPVIGAAVFAASKVLAPLWNKISVLRYHITGPLDKPEINEVLREAREK